MKINFLFLFVIISISNFSQKSSEFIFSENQEYRTNLNAHYADSLHSPLTEEDRTQFDTLPFFPVDTNYYIEAKFVKIKRGKKFKMKTSTSREPIYKVYGKAVFSLRDTTYELMIYQNLDLTKKEGYEEYLFLPFNDFTNGNETYGGGRYLDLQIPNGDYILIDFNKAYNPYCAYTVGYSCPIPPRENALNTYIWAGIKFEGEKH